MTTLRFRFALLLAFLCVPLALRGQTAGTLDAGFNPNSNGPLLGIAVQPDGKTVIEGGFSMMGGVSRLRAARVDAAGALDLAFNPNITGNFAWCMAVLPDGKMIVGGEFTAVGGVARNYIARLNANGTLDASFNPNANATVKCLALQADGKTVIGGDFTTIGGVTRNRIARLNADGTLDTTFDPNANGVVSSVLVEADQRIIVAGGFTTIGATTRNRLARINANGTLDTFNPNVNSAIFSAALQADGKILVGGNFTMVGSTTRNRFARINANSVLDSAFNPNVNNLIYSIAVQADGKIVIGGTFSSVGATARERIARVNADGTLDTAFIASTSDTVNGIALQADGGILVGSFFTVVNGQSRNAVARLANDAATAALTVTNASRVQWLRGGATPEAESVTFELSTDGGANWTLLGAGTRIAGGWQRTGLNLPASGSVRARARTRGGYVNGSTGLVEEITVFNLPAGSVDGTFNTTGALNPYGIAVQPDGKIAIANLATAGFPEYCLRLQTVGSLDQVFSPSANNQALSAAIQADGKIVFGGDFTAPGFRLTRYIATGTRDTAFSATADLTIYWIAPQPDGKLIVGGNFNTMNGVSRFKVARLNENGSLDTSFVNPSVLAPVWTGALQPDGKVIIGGAFETVGGVTRNYIARLQPNGTLDTSFNATADGQVDAVALQADGKIIVGGTFTSVGGVTRNRIARLNADGSLDTNFNPNLNDLVLSIVLQADGKIIVGGWYTTVGGASRRAIARLNTDGSLDPTFDVGTINGVLVSTALQADGKVLIGGSFTNINGSSRTTPTRLLNDPATQTVTVPNTSRVQWLRGGSAPETHAVTFELSTDGGSSWTPLGPGARIAGGWERTGLSLPATGTIRARARTSGGNQNGSSGLVEQVQAFVLMPGATTAAVTNIRAASARLNGTATPNGMATTAHFDYSTDPTFATGILSTPNIPIGSGGSAVPVTANIGGLTPGTIYYVRLVAQNPIGTTTAAAVNFTTNTPPTGGSFVVLPETAAPGAIVQLFALGWTDPQTPLTYQFFLDGAPLGPAGFPSTASFAAPAAPGNHAVKLRVADTLGDFTEAESILLVNVPPADGSFIVSPSVAAPGATVQLSAPGWTDPQTPLTYQFFLDTTPLGPAGTSSTASFAAPTTLGTYPLKVRIADALGESTEATGSLVVNNPPVIRVSTLGAVSGNTAEISTAKLLRYATDPDGDAMQIVAVSPASAQGGTVALLNGVIHYTAPAGYSGPDSFTYTVRDASGSIATGTVNVIVAHGSAPSLNVVSITPTADGFLVRFAGVPGASYRIQYRDALTDAWQLLDPPGTIQAGANGIFEHEDKPNPKPASRFYRAIAP